MSESIYIVYETTNLINGKYYIGVHKVNGSNYLGYGVLLTSAVKKYGRSNFIRETLRSFDNKDDAYKFESLIVTKDLTTNPHCYNKIIGGIGGFDHIDNKGENNHFYGKTHTTASRKLISDNHADFTGNKHPMYGKRGKNSPLSKHYEITHPDGHTEIIYCMKDFCVAMGLNASSMHNVNKGRRSHHKGFTCKSI
jgi:hypothetical protein